MIAKKGAAPTTTKDGMTILQEIELRNRFEHIGAQFVKEAAYKTFQLAGAGVTSAILLAEAIYAEGISSISLGADPVSIRRGIEKSVQVLVGKLDQLAIPVTTIEQMEQIASVAAQGDPDSGSYMRRAIEEVGKRGGIFVAAGKEEETLLIRKEGVQVEGGYLSPYFVTDPENMTVEWENAAILITERKISRAEELIPLLEKIVKAGQKPLLIIAGEIKEEPLSLLVLNHVEKKIPLCAIQLPACGEMQRQLFEDLALLTGAILLPKEGGFSLEEAPLSVLGSAKTVLINRQDTTLRKGGGDPKKIEERIEQIRAECAKSQEESDRQRLEERVSWLSQKVVCIQVGGTTQAERKEKKRRMEGALQAVRNALLHGFVPGGGVAYLRALPALDTLSLSQEERRGIDIIRRACLIPAATIARNCGREEESVIHKISQTEGGFGYNGIADRFEDLVEAGILDPVLIPQSALKSAASVAALMLSVSCMVGGKKETHST